MKKFRLKPVLQSLLGPFIITAMVSACNGGGGSCGTTTTQSTSTLNVYSELFQNGQTYTVSVFTEDSENEADASCIVANHVCEAKIPQADFIVGDVDVVVTQNKTLVAADGTVDSSYFLSTQDAPFIVMDERTTGNYIIDGLQNLAENEFPDADVTTQITSYLDINENDANIDFLLPVTAYEFFKAAQGSQSQNDGFYKTFYYLYGNLSTRTTANVSGAKTSSTSSLLAGKALQSGDDKSNPVDNSGEIKPKENSPANSVPDLTAKASDEAKQTDWSKGVDAATINSISKTFAKKLGVTQIPTTPEDVQSWMIAKDVTTIGLKGLDLVYPGVGTILSAISNGLFSSVIGAPPDPNKPMIDALNLVNDSVKQVSSDLNNIQLQNLQIKVNEQSAKFSEALIKINSAPNAYLTRIKTVQKSSIKPGLPAAAALDIYLEKQAANGRLDAQIALMQEWFSSQKDNKNLIDSVKTLVDDANLRLINNTIKTTMNQQIDAIVKDKQQSDLKDNGAENIILIKKNAIAQSLEMQNQLILAIEKIRTYHLAAAYLHYSSKYKFHFKKMDLGIEGFAAGDYASAVKAINKYYYDLEIATVTTMNNSFEPIARDIYKGFPRNNAEDYFDKSLLYTAPYQCRVTYWNGKSVGYSCIGNSGESQPVNYFIGNVAAACKTKIQRLSAQRFGCETTYFNAKWQLNTGDVGPSFDNFKKYWPKSWRHNDNAWRTSPYLVFYPTGLFAKNNMVKGAVTHFYTPYTNFFKVMREVAVKSEFGTPGGKDTTHTSSYYPYFDITLLLVNPSKLHAPLNKYKVKYQFFHLQ